MNYKELLMTWANMESTSKHRQRIEIRDRAREDIAALERDIATLERLIQELRSTRLKETTKPPTGPLTPAQSVQRAERDRKRQERIKDIHATAAKRVADIKTTIGR